LLIRAFGAHVVQLHAHAASNLPLNANIPALVRLSTGGKG
jgi:hypothetical protein